MKRLEIKTLAKGYCDPDRVLLHACFAILVDFIENEKPYEMTDADITGSKEEIEFYKSQLVVDREMRELYKWWTVDRLKRVDPIMRKDLKMVMYDAITDQSNVPEYKEWVNACDESNRLEKEWLEEDQKNLHRLIDIRDYLWT